MLTQSATSTLNPAGTGTARPGMDAREATRIAADVGRLGSTHRVTVAASVGRDLTVQGWFKADAPASASTQQLFWLPGSTAGSSFELLMRGGQLLTWASGGSDRIVSGFKPDGLWHHYALSTDGAGNWTVHVDGVSLQTRSGPTTATAPADALAGGDAYTAIIGNHASGANSFKGLVGNVQLWDTARSTTQIATDMDSRYAGGQDSAGNTPTDLKGSWQLGTSLANEVAGGRDATRASGSSLHNHGATAETGAATGMSAFSATTSTTTTTTTKSPTTASLDSARDDAGMRTWSVSASEATRIASDIGKPGSSHRVTVSAAVGGDLTVQGWFKADAPASASTQQLFWLPGSGAGSSFELFMRGGQLLTWASGGSDSIVSGFSPDGLWHHYALSTDGAGNWSVHVDGVRLHSRSGPATTPGGTAGTGGTTGNFTAIVGNHATGSNSFKGLVGNLQIWDSQRSATQITQDMTSVYVGGKDDGGAFVNHLKGSWLMGTSLANEVAGGAIADRAAGSVVADIGRSHVSDDRTQSLGGTLGAELVAGETVEILDGSTVLGTAQVSGRSWSFTTPVLAEGDHSFTARVRDVSGRLGPLSKAYGVQVDTTAPTTTISLATATDDAGRDRWTVTAGEATRIASETGKPVSTHKVTVSANAGRDLTIEGWFKSDDPGDRGPSTATQQLFWLPGQDAGSSFELFIRGGQLITWATNGRDQVVPGITPDRQWHHYAVSTDGAGNWSVHVDGVKLETRSGPVTANGGNFVATVGNHASSANSFNGWVGNIQVWDSQRSNSQIAQDLLNVYVDGKNSEGVRQPELKGSWVMGASLANEVAGGAAAVRGSGSIVAALDRPLSSNDATQTLTGRLGADLVGGEEVLILDGSTVLGTAVVTGRTWTFTTPPLADGSHALTARVRDAAGNLGPSSASHVVDIGHTHVLAPDLSLARDTGDSASDGITSAGTLEVKGLAQGANWQYQVDEGPWLDGVGRSFEATRGTHRYAVRQTDLHGNVSMASNRLSVTLDDQAPTQIAEIGTPCTRLATRAGLGETHRISLSPTVSGNLTVEGWFKAAEAGHATTQQLFWLAGKELFIRGGVLYTWSAATGDLSTGVTVDSQWHHYALSTDGAGAWQVHVDGAHKQSASGGSIGSTAAAQTIEVGNHRTGNNSFNGWIGNVQVWDSQRSTADLGKDMHTAYIGGKDSTGAMAPSLIGSWLLGQSLGNEIPGGSAAVRGSGSTVDVRIDVPTTWAGTASTASTAVTRIAGHAGGDANHQVTVSAKVSRDLTIEAWFKADEPEQPVTQQLFSLPSASGGRGFGLFLWGGYLFMSSADGTNNVVTSFATDKLWHHYALSTDGAGNWTVHVDGVQLMTSKGSTTATSDSLLVAMLGNQHGREHGLQGLVGNVQLWDSQRSTSEIVKDMAWTYRDGKDSAGKTPAHLKGSWQLGKSLDNEVTGGLDATRGSGSSVVETRNSVFGGTGVNDLTGTLDTELAPGETLVILEGSTVLGTAQVTGKSWTFTTPRLGQGGHDLVARVRDLAGQDGPVSASYRIDVAPEVPSLSLMVDSGASGTDGITRVSTVKVNGLPTGGRWEYQVDTGDWKAGETRLEVLPSGGVQAVMNGRDIGANMTARAVDWQGSGKSVTAWFVFYDGVYTKGVKVEFTNNAERGLLARAVKAAFATGDRVADWSSASLTDMNVATVDGAPGYGVKAIRIWGQEVHGGYLGTTASALPAMPPAFALTDGTHSYAVRRIDASGEVLTTSKHVLYTLDKGSPTAAPALTLAADPTGNPASRKAHVSGIDKGNSWQYSTDKGANWINGVMDPVRPKLDELESSRFTATLHGGSIGHEVRATALGLSAAAGGQNGSRTLWLVAVDGGYTKGVKSEISVASDGSLQAKVLLAGYMDGNRLSDWMSLVNTSTLKGQHVAESDSAGGYGLKSLAVDGLRFSPGYLGTGSPTRLPDAYLLALPAGSSEIIARQVDVAGNVSPTSPTLVVTSRLETLAAAPTLTLSRDTGASDTDGVTSNAVVKVEGLNGNPWEYSRDGGQTWTRKTLDYQDVRQDMITATLGGGYLDGPRAATVVGLSMDISFQSAWLITQDGGYTKGVKVQFLRDGDKLAARVLTARFVAGNHLSDWMSVVDSDAARTQAVATGDRADGYGVKSIQVKGVGFGSGYLDTVNLKSWDREIHGGSSITLPDGDYAAGQVMVRQLDSSATSPASQVSANSRAWTIDAKAVKPEIGLINLADGAIAVNRLESGSTWKYRVDGGDWIAGKGSSISASSGKHTYEVAQVDLSGSVSSISEPRTHEFKSIDRLVLDHDTGVDGNDGITTSGKVMTPSVGSRPWSYSLDAGNTWKVGSDLSFQLPEGTYAAGQVLVSRQSGGITGTSEVILVNGRSWTVDRQVMAPTVAVDPDKPGTLRVEGLEPGASWEYRVDAGAWVRGTGQSFESLPGTHTLEVRQTDRAGNTSKAQEPLRYTAPLLTPTLSLQADTGALGSDGVTRKSALLVTDLKPGNTWQYQVDGGAWQDGRAGIALTSLSAGKVTAVINGSYIEADMDAKAVDWHEGASTVTTWLVFYDSVYTKGVQLELSQGLDGAIQARALKAAYATGDHRDNWAAALTIEYAVATADDLPGYGIKALLLDGILVSEGYLTTDSTRLVRTMPGLELQEGPHTYAVRQIDASGQASAVSKSVSYTLDTQAPGTPALRLRQDTGTDGSDGLTREAEVLVSGLEPGARWEYRVDDGDWQAGGMAATSASAASAASTSSFRLIEGRHGYAVRQIDLAGHASEGSPVVYQTLDTRAPANAPVLKPIANAGGDFRQVQVSGLESGAVWQYQIDGGAWTTGTGDRLDLVPGVVTYTVRQLDKAGNPGATSRLTDMLPAAPRMTLLDDTGAGTQDGVTRESAVQVRDAALGARWQYRVDDGAWTSAGKFLGIKDLKADMITATLNGGSISANQTATVLDWRESGTTRTGWLVFEDGTYTKGIRFEFSAGTDTRIKVRLLEAGFATGKHLSDWATVSKQAMGLANGDGAPGYGVKVLKILGVQVNEGYLGTTPLTTPFSDGFHLIDGRHGYAVEQLDPTGAVIASSQVSLFTLDTTAPAMPTLSLAPASHDVTPTGVSRSGHIQVSGLESNSTWQYRLDGGGWIDGSGDSFRASPGNHFYEVRTRDAAGNVSSAPNLLRNGDFERGDADFRTDYTALASTATAGTYAVVTTVADRGLGHPGVRQGDGKFLLVNGARDASKVVWSQEVELKAGVPYDFGARTLASAGAVLQLTVNGTDVEGSFRPLPGADWQQWSLRFVSTTTGKVTLGIRNKGTADAGNDVALDDLSLQKVTGLEVHGEPLTLKLSNDTGADAGDGITHVPDIVVSGLESGQAWQWRMDGGTWQTGQDNRFQAQTGKHRYEVRGHFPDGFGVTSPALEVRLDQQAPDFDNKALQIAATAGTSSKASAELSLSSTDGASIVFWARASDLTTQTTRLLSTDGKFGDLLFDNGKLVFESGGTRVHATTTGQGTQQALHADVSLDTQWHHYALNLDGQGRVSVHRDGQQVLVHQLPATTPFNAVKLDFGGHATRDNQGWGGEMLNIQVWDRALTAAQLVQVQAPLLDQARSSSDLRAWWPDGKSALSDVADLRLSGQAGQQALFNVLELQTKAPAFNLFTNGAMDDADNNIGSDYTRNSPGNGAGTQSVVATPPAWGLGIERGHGNGGKFLMADGATDASKKVWSQKVRLETGVSYDFSGFVAANEGVVLQLSVDGRDVGDAFNPKAGAGWQAWRTAFTSTVTGEATVGIRARSTASSQNDFALDSLTLVRVADGLNGSALTRDGVILVNGLVSDARWQWRMDDGPWVDGDSEKPEIRAATGRHGYQVRQVDTAGNVGPASATYTVLHDNVAPLLDTVTRVFVQGGERGDVYATGGQVFGNTLQSESMTGLGSTWTIGADQAITLGGQHGANLAVQVFINGRSQPAAVTTTDAQGRWTLTLLPSAMALLPLGRNRIDVRLVDEAGNASREQDSIVLTRIPAMSDLGSQRRTVSAAQPAEESTTRQVIFHDRLEDHPGSVSHATGIAKLGTNPGAPPSGNSYLLSHASDENGFWRKTVSGLARGEVVQFSFMLSTGQALQEQLPRIALYANGEQVGTTTLLPQGSGWTQVTVNFVKVDEGLLTLVLRNVNRDMPSHVHFGIDDIKLAVNRSNDAGGTDPATPPNLLSAGTFELGSARPGAKLGVSLLPEAATRPSKGEAAALGESPAEWNLGSGRAHGGERFLAVHSRGAGQVVWSEALDAQPGATLSLRAWVTTGDDSPPLLRLKANGEFVSGVMTSAIGRSAGWTQVEVTFKAPMSPPPLVLSLEDHGSGGARFGLDDLVLRRLDAPAGSDNTGASGVEPSAPGSPASQDLDPQAQALAGNLSKLLGAMRASPSDAQLLAAFKKYLSTYNEIAPPPPGAAVKPFVSQLTEQVIDDRWRLLLRTIMKNKFDGSIDETRKQYNILLANTPWREFKDQTAWNQAKQAALVKEKNEFIGLTGKLLGVAWNQASAYALGAQINNFKLTGDAKADSQAQLKLAANAMFEITRLMIFMTAGDSYLNSLIVNKTALTGKDVAKIGATVGFGLNGLIRLFMLGDIGLNFDKAVKMNAGQDRDLAITRSTFDLLSAATGSITNLGLAFGAWNTGGRDAVVNIATRKYLAGISDYTFKPHLGTKSSLTMDIKANFESKLSWGKSHALAVDKITAISGVLQSLFSIVSLSTYFGDSSLSSNQKVALAFTVGGDMFAAAAGSLATYQLQKAIAQGAAASKAVVGLSGALAMLTFVSYINPLQAEQIDRLYKNALKMQELADSLGRFEKGYSGDQYLADLYHSQGKTEAALYGTQLGLGLVSSIASVAGGPIGWAVSLVTSLVAMVVEAIRQPILEQVATDKRNQMLEESGGDLHAYFAKGVQATFANMLQDPEVKAYFTDQLQVGDFDKVIGLISVNQDGAMRNLAAMTKTSEFLPQWSLFTAEIDRALALTDSTSARVDTTLTRIDVTSSAERQKIFVTTPLAPHGTSNSMRVNVAGEVNKTLLKNLKQSGWTLVDGASSSVIDLSDVVSLHLSTNDDRLDFMYYRFYRMSDEWMLGYNQPTRPWDSVLPDVVKREIKTTTGGADYAKRGATKMMEYLSGTGEIDQYFRELFTAPDPWSGTSNSMATRYGLPMTGLSGGAGTLRVTTQAPDWGLGSRKARGGSGDRFLMVDGATSKSSRVWAQDVDMESGKTYEFSAWMMGNAGSSLRLTVDGSDVTSDLSPSAGSGWQLISASFTSPKSGKVSLGLRATNGSSSGNDFALDDLVLRPGDAANLVRNPYFDDAEAGFTSDYTMVPGGELGTGKMSILSTPPNWGLGITGDRIGTQSKFLMVDGASQPDRQVWSQKVQLVAGKSYDFSAFVAGNDRVSLQFTLDGRPVGTSFQPRSGAGWQEWRTTFTSDITGTVTVGIRDVRTDTESNDFALDGLSITQNLIANGGFEAPGGFTTDYRRETTLSSLQSELAVNWVATTHVSANGGDDVISTGLGEYVIHGGAGIDLVDYSANSDERTSLTFKYSGGQVNVEKRNQIGTLNSSGINTSSSSYGKRTEIIQYVDLFKVDDVRIDSVTLLDRLIDVELIKGSRGRDHYIGDAGDQFFACNDLQDFFSGGGGTDIVDLNQLRGTDIDLSDLGQHFKDIDLAVFGHADNPRTTTLGGDGHAAPTLVYGNGRDVVDASLVRNAGVHVQKVADSAVSGLVFTGSAFGDLVDHGVTIASHTFSELKVDTADGNDVVSLGWSGAYEANNFAQDTLIRLGAGTDSLYLNLSLTMGSEVAPQAIRVEGGAGTDTLFVKGSQGLLYDDSVHPDMLAMGNIQIHATGFEAIRGTELDDFFIMPNSKTRAARYFHGSGGDDVYIGAAKAVETIDHSLRETGLRLSIVSGDKTQVRGENAHEPEGRLPFQKLGLVQVDVVIGTPLDDIVLAGGGGEHLDLGLGNDIFSAARWGHASVALGQGDDHAHFLGGNLNLKGDAGRDTFRQAPSTGLSAAQVTALQAEASQVWIAADGGDTVRLSSSNFMQSVHIEHAGRDWGSLDVLFDDGEAAFNNFLWFKDTAQNKLAGIWSPSSSDENIRSTYLKVLEFSLDDPAVLLHFDDGRRSTTEIAAAAYEDTNLIEVRTLQGLDDLFHQNRQFDDPAGIYMEHGEGYLVRMLAAQDYILSESARASVL